MQSVTAVTATNEAHPLFDLNVYIQAFHKCKLTSGWKESVQNFEANRLKKLPGLINKIKSGTYTPDPYFEFDISERGKHRHIKALTVRDRVLMRAFCDNVLTPAIKSKLIYDNGASAENKGITFARKRFLTHLHRFYRKHGSNDGWILQIDFRHFFDSIDHELLKQAFYKVVPDPVSHKFLNQVIDSFGGDKGLGIGSQISQCAGVLFPSPIDHFCKTVKQCKYYGRYMDDIYVIHHDPGFLKSLLQEIRAQASKLKLELHPYKTHICRLDKPFVFLKSTYRLTDTGKVLYTPARVSIVRERRKLKRLHAIYEKRKIPPNDIRNAYKSWRNNLIKNFPNSCSRTIKSMDTLFKSLFGDANK